MNFLAFSDAEVESVRAKIDTTVRKYMGDEMLKFTHYTLMQNIQHIPVRRFLSHF